ARGVAQPHAASRGRLLALLVELLVRGEGAGRLALGEKALRGLAVVRLRVALQERALVPPEAQPVEPLEDGAGVGFRGPLAVGVLEAEDEHSPVLAGPEPVEEGGPCSTDVEESGGARREAYAQGHGGG